MQAARAQHRRTWRHRQRRGPRLEPSPRHRRTRGSARPPPAELGGGHAAIALAVDPRRDTVVLRHRQQRVIEYGVSSSMTSTSSTVRRNGTSVRAAADAVPKPGAAGRGPAAARGGGRRCAARRPSQPAVERSPPAAVRRRMHEVDGAAVIARRPVDRRCSSSRRWRALAGRQGPCQFFGSDRAGARGQRRTRPPHGCGKPAS